MARGLGIAACVALLAGCSSQSASQTEPSPFAPTPVGPSASAASPLGLTIPWAVGHRRDLRDGTVRFDMGEWPTFPVGAMRLWDARTTWLNLEPANDQWDFRTLDAHLANAFASGVRDVMLVLASTPRWAAVRVTPEDAPWLGPGSASPPADLAQWREYVRTVATRYAARIRAYEIGNEPNLLTFWNGTPEQWRDLVASAVEEIRAADPAATIVVNAGLVRRAGDIDALHTWLAPLRGIDGIDVVSVHVYPRASRLADLPGLLAQARAVVADSGVGRGDPWMTEVNVSDGSGLTAAQQEAAVTEVTDDVLAAGFNRVYWYAWTRFGPDDLIELAPGTAGAAALATLAMTVVPPVAPPLTPGG